MSDCPAGHSRSSNAVLCSMPAIAGIRLPTLSCPAADGVSCAGSCQTPIRSAAKHDENVTIAAIADALQGSLAADRLQKFLNFSVQQSFNNRTVL